MKSHFLAVVFIIFLFGCAPATPFPTAMSVPTVMPATQQMTLVTASPTVFLAAKNTPSPTWTLFPTLLPETGLATLYDWLDDVDGCHLPCWAGITPGKTNWAKAQQLMESMSGFAKVETFRDETCSFGGCNEIRWSLNFPNNGIGYVYSILPDDKVHLLLLEIIDPDLSKAFELKKILMRYGKPNVLLFTTDPEQPGQKFLEMILVYPESQFLIKYSYEAELSGDQIISCGKISYIYLLVLDNKEQLLSLDVIANAVETKDLQVDKWWRKSVEKASDMTIDDFYETYTKVDAPCITISSEIWVP